MNVPAAPGALLSNGVGGALGNRGLAALALVGRTCEVKHVSAK